MIRFISKFLKYTSKDKKASLEDRIKKANDKIKLKLIDKLKKSPIKKREKYFALIARTKNNIVKAKLAYNLHVLTDSKTKVKWFKRLSKSSDDLIRAGLISNLRLLPKNSRINCKELIA